MVEFARRDALGALALGAAGLALPAWAVPATIGATTGLVDFPEKRQMLLRRQRAPLLETPFEVFDQDIITPNDRFFVRWHYDDIPLSVDVASFRLRVEGHVARQLSLSLAEILKMPRIEVTAVNQCSGNSRSRFAPPVPGGQWGDGAMGNAVWTGVRLKDVLARAGVKPGAVAVRLSGLDRPPGNAPWFAKSLAVDHALDGEVMIAFAMNGQQLPLLNGFPLRIVVPGWYSTYWVKALDRIELLNAPDDNFWMAKAYQIPKTPRASVAPGTTDFAKEPISKMVPRAFVTNQRGGVVKAGVPLALRGIALGGASALTKVELSLTGGQSWQAARLGRDHGRYSFRGWDMTINSLPAGQHRLAVRATNSAGEHQFADAIWNPGGYMLSTIDAIMLDAR
ncbi:molybdopterin-dependent oxidoreductase [Sphingomonas sp. 28-63-12]|uniref:molybdopterin-dependent oxidoreductase n=1 Tax=Sphingomonas sp. 28-63-12 TaxID=1970434 RepID=UPI000BC90275|nr:MAG: oxidase [Sphingomonas sp. 28-63-12]